MAVLINLIPDIKRQKLQARRTTRIIFGIATIIVVLSVAVPVILFITVQSQKLLISNTTKEIEKNHQDFVDTPDIQLILNTQSNLGELPALYEKRVFSSKLYADLQTRIPAGIKFSKLNLTAGGQLDVNGTGTTYALVHKFVAALEAATFGDSKQAVYSNVTLGSINADSDSSSVNFTITADYNTELIQ